MQYSTITSWARLIWDALGHYGIDGDDVFREVGLDPSVLEDPNARYPIAGMFRLWHTAASMSGDPCFGLTAAEQWRPTTWHGLGFAWLASATLNDAFRRLVRYSAIVASAADVRIEERPGRVRLSIGSRSGVPQDPSAAVIDAIVAVVIHMSQEICGRGFQPLRVELTHRGAGCRQRRREFFGCPVEYGASQNAVEVSADVASRTLPSANAELAHANERVIRDYLSQVRGGFVAQQVKLRLINELSSGSVRAATVAKELNMSPRTLQRRLSEEETSFSAVVDDTRRELAIRLIGDRTMTLGEISYLLGFSEESSFSRSFRRWTGTSPSDYRKRRI
jgi:AraC-like DNA-binding protein